MNRVEVRDVLETTADAAFAVDCEGLVVGWNAKATAVFGISATEAIGKACCSLITGSDECGSVCSNCCPLIQALNTELVNQRAVDSFDLLVPTLDGPVWHNVSVLLVADNSHHKTIAIHILKKVDIRKRLEMVIRDFLLGAGLSPDASQAVINSYRLAKNAAILSPRELQILQMLSGGQSTEAIGDELCISRTTVNNHLQNILRKLDVHSRLEAIRRAEKSGLLH